MKIREQPSFIDYLELIFKRRVFILKTVISVAIAAVIISLCLRHKYTASTTILPPNPQQDMMFGFVNPALTSSLGGASGLTSLLAGGSRPSDLFAAILNSGRITGNIIRKYNLKQVFKAKTNHDAAKQLKEITRIGVTPEGMITVSVTWYDKYLAADIANSYIEELDEFNTETAMTTGKKYRIFIEGRLKETIDTLTMVEERLRKFQEEHHTLILDVEIEKAIETIAELKSQIILLEVKKGALTSSSQTGNPYLHSINRELRELKKQLSKIEFGGNEKKRTGFGAGFSIPFSQLPEVSLEFARLIRDVTVQSAIYELLTQQYEQAKIMELKDTPTVQILDRASPPEKKSAPKRSRIVILTTVLGMILSVVGAFILESLEKTKKYPDRHKKWLDLLDKCRRDARLARTFIFKTLRIKKKLG